MGEVRYNPVYWHGTREQVSAEGYRHTSEGRHNKNVKTPRGSDIPTSKGTCSPKITIVLTKWNSNANLSQNSPRKIRITYGTYRQRWFPNIRFFFVPRHQISLAHTSHLHFMFLTTYPLNPLGYRRFQLSCDALYSHAAELSNYKGEAESNRTVGVYIGADSGRNGQLPISSKTCVSLCHKWRSDFASMAGWE